MKSITIIYLFYLLYATADETASKVSNDCFYFSELNSFFYQIVDFKMGFHIMYRAWKTVGSKELKLVIPHIVVALVAVKTE